MWTSAIGDDGRWHPWEDLTEAEREAWETAMSTADRMSKEERSLGLDGSLRRYEEQHRMDHW